MCLKTWPKSKIGEYIDGTRQNTTTNVLWEGNTSSGTLELAESIYNYDFLIIIADSYIHDIIYINKEGMDKIYGGSSYAYTDTNIVGYWGFYISSISDDGEELVLTKSGAASSSATWSTNYNITKIIGLK